jgi:hypothetical protein
MGVCAETTGGLGVGGGYEVAALLTGGADDGAGGLGGGGVGTTDTFTSDFCGASARSASALDGERGRGGSETGLLKAPLGSEGWRSRAPSSDGSGSVSRRERAMAGTRAATGMESGRDAAEPGGRCESLSWGLGGAEGRVDSRALALERTAPSEGFGC